eukprot:COSAG02_NODE_15445_length_1171_cov_0.885261_4_plen_28_part_01
MSVDGSHSLAVLSARSGRARAVLDFGIE